MCLSLICHSDALSKTGLVASGFRETEQQVIHLLLSYVLQPHAGPDVAVLLKKVEFFGDLFEFMSPTVRVTLFGSQRTAKFVQISSKHLRTLAV